MDPRALADLRSITREQLDDLGIARPRYSDAMIDRGLNEGQREACERARLIRDEVTACTQLAILADQAYVDLHRSIFEVERVLHLDSGDELTEARESTLSANDRRWRERVAATPCEFIVQALPDERIRLRLVPIPTVACNLQLTVYRLPLFPMEGDGDEPEIAARHHEKLVSYAVYKALMTKDPDLYDPVKAAEHLGVFTAEFGEKVDAETRRRQRENRDPCVVSRWG